MKVELKQKGERIGQSIFNFLEWLAVEKNIPLNQSHRMADPFFIEDKDMVKFINEYNKI